MAEPELNLGLPPLPEPRPRRPFYAGVAMSTTGTQDYGTPNGPGELFDAICCYWGRVPADTPREQIPRPWVDPFASAWNALVPHFFSLPGHGGAAVDGLKQSWKPPQGAPRFVVFNPVYEESEQACAPRCKKKGCAERGFCLSEYKPGMSDALLKAESEAMDWQGTTIGILPARQASWFRRVVAPPWNVAGAFLGGEAWPGPLSPMAPHIRVVAHELYRYERLHVETVRLAERQTFRAPPGAVSATTGKPLGKDSAGFDTLLVAWTGQSL